MVRLQLKGLTLNDIIGNNLFLVLSRGGVRSSKGHNVILYRKILFLREICFDRGSLSLVVVFFYLQEMINLYLTVLTNLFQKELTQKNNFILWQCFYFYFYLYFSQTSNLQSRNLPFFSPAIALTHLLKAFTQWHAM